MFMTITKDANARNNNGMLFQAKVAQIMFGDLSVSNIALSQQRTSAKDVELTPVASDLENVLAPDKSWVFVAFQFNDRPNAAALKRYIEDRQPALDNHGGRVFLSGVTTRSSGWQYDGVELIEFPQPDSAQALMQDPDYLKRTAQSSAVFGRAFAMAYLAPVSTASM